MSEKIIPTIQIEKIVSYLNEGKRLDGRTPLDFREISVTKEISKNAESAVSVKIGKTEVYCGVKMAVVEPYADSANEGTFMTSAELHPMASNDFDIGKPGIEAIELGRVIDRGIRESGFLDFKGLCIKEGEKVWQVFLDIVVVNNDGNVFDAAGIGGLIALGTARMPKYNETENKIEHEFTDKPLPLNEEALSFNITIHKIGNKLIVDPSVQEEEVSDYRLSIAIADNKGEPRITAMQKGKPGTISSKDMQEITNIVKEIHKNKFGELKKLVFS